MAQANPSRARPRGAKQRALLTVSRLAAEYPEGVCALVHSNALELLVATILSAQTTDERVNMVTPNLFAKYPTAAALAGAAPADMEEIVRSTGFFRDKTRAVIGMAQQLVTDFGGEVPSRMEDLVTLRGVGRKTANVVLGVAFGIPGFPVDTHVSRLTGRLHLTKEKDPVAIEKDICSMVDPQEWTNLSLRLILHGRAVCVARKPKCEVCFLNDFCPSSSVKAVRPQAAG